MKEKKYSDYNTLQEINDLADRLFNNDEKEEIRVLATEKGLDEYLCEMYLNGQMPALVPDAMTGTAAKLDMEVSELEKDNMELGTGIAEYMKQQAMEKEEIAEAVMQPGKHLEDICKMAWEEAKKRKKGRCVYIPPFEIFQMAKAYYLKRGSSNEEKAD